MDKNTITGFALIFLILTGWIFYANKQQVALEKQQAKNKKTEIANYPVNNITTDSTSKAVIINTDSATISNYGSFTNSNATPKNIVIENENCKYTFSSKGGVLESVELLDYKTFDKKPLYIFDKNEKVLNISFNTADSKELINTQNVIFNTDATSKKISGTDKINIVFSVVTATNQTYQHIYTIQGKGYMLDFEIAGNGLNTLLANNTKNIQLNWSQNMISTEKEMSEERTYADLYFRNDIKEVDNIGTKDKNKTIETPLQWISFKRKFFNATLIAKKQNFATNGTLAITTPNEKDSSKTVRSTTAQLQIPFDGKTTFSFPMQFYFGPNKFKELKSYKIGLDEIIPLGWAILGWVNKFFIIPIFNFLHKFISSYGIIILLLTIIIKLVTYPFTSKSYMSMVKMKVLKPEIEELKAKYGKDKQVFGAKQMELFNKAGVNPMGGCLPMLLQMPILMAMYRFFPNSIELRQEPFLWATDLSSYDSIFNLPFSIPAYGAHISLFTILMAISSFVYTRMNAQSQPSGGSDDMMAQQMKIMQYFMPFMLLFIFNKFSAALSYYYFLFNILSIFQQWFMQKFLIDEDKIHAEIQANKKNPAKKSKFQDKLTEIMKQQQEAKKNSK